MLTTNEQHTAGRVPRMAGPLPIIYLTAGEVAAFNHAILQRAGQSSALLRDRALLESAVQRPQNAAYYSGADLIEQAALYMVGIALNHPFVDGNKRTGYIAGMTFLQVNGYVTMDVSLNDVQFGMWLEQVVNRHLSLEAFVQLLRQRLPPPRNRQLPDGGSSRSSDASDTPL